MAVGRNYLEALERKKRLLERLQRLEAELKEEQERLRAREVDWALRALTAVLEEEGVWGKVENHWRKVAEDRFELWRALGLDFLLPDGREARIRVGEETIADRHEETQDGEQEQEKQEQGEREAQPGPEPEEAAQPRMSGSVGAGVVF